MATKTFKVSLSLDNPRIIQSGINVHSFDKQSIKISIELTKNSQVYQIPTDAQIKISLLKLARQEQKIILDVPFTSADSIDWIVPDYLDGYQGEVRVGVYLIVGTENIDVGYFNITSSVSDIDSAAEEFTESVLQGWAIEDLTALLPQFQAVIDETTGKDVISAPEIILARNGEADLKTRLDKDQQQVTAQLAQKAQQTDLEVTDGRVDNLIATAGDGTIPSELTDIRVGLSGVTYETAGKSVREQLKNNLKYNQVNLKDKFRTSLNLVDPSTITNNTAMDVDGTLFPVSGYYVTDYIKLNGNNVSGIWLASDSNPHLAVYDENFKFIRTVISSEQTYLYQPGDYYIRAVFRTTVTPVSSAMINYGNAMLPYTPYREKKASLSNTLYVGTQNGCDYKTIQEALDSIIDDSEINPYVIFIMPGVYERFSMIKPVNRLRYISLIAFDRVTTIIKSDTGTYETPPAEIWTNGTIENITFEMKTSAETFTGVGRQPQAYAVHQDFGTSETLYKNCVMYSNAGPAGGFGTYENGKMLFHDCDFITESDNTYGTNTLGAMFIHTNSVDPDINQYAEFKNCNAVNKHGAEGFRLRIPTGAEGSYAYLVQNCGSWGVNGANAFVNEGILDPKSFGNNTTSLNA